MTLEMMLKERHDDGRDEGRTEGIAIGEKRGEKRGRAEGMAAGKNRNRAKYAKRRAFCRSDYKIHRHFSTTNKRAFVNFLSSEKK
ncbi:MAG: hypothetical protein HDR34_10150 [Treponema sp.]|nr:hypothetical protein [Treponema sp.]